MVVELTSLEKFNLIELEQKGFIGHSQCFREDFTVSYLGFSRLLHTQKLLLHELIHPTHICHDQKFQAKQSKEI